MALPSSPIDVTKLMVTKKAVLVFTPTGGAAITFEGKQIDNNPSITEGEVTFPDDNGVLRPIYTWVSAESDIWTFTSPEVRRLLEIFSGALTGRREGTVVIYLPHLSDASGFVALKSESFPCTVTRSGNMVYQSSQGTEMAIQVKSTKAGPVLFTDTAAV